MPPRPPTSTLFPYTTLFRSHHDVGVRRSFSRKLPPEFLAALLNGTPKDYAVGPREVHVLEDAARLRRRRRIEAGDRKSTRLNSSHVAISYAVFCLKKKKESE